MAANLNMQKLHLVFLIVEEIGVSVFVRERREPMDRGRIGKTSG
jgi:hypothetical protein